ncbi:MAG: benzoyl-CoA 2,3-epoxidase subunit BoxA [Betaproteobacteria bacterium]|nr:benzoyl-CoA 2,3-epoxidase subunit BoxA [Betaproteobacteria bacterium]
MDIAVSTVVKQHLIDPECCIRCNTCESVCPSSAITHDARNYVVDVSKCTACMTCIGPCPTGAIDTWRTVPRAMAYGLQDQFGWDSLPDELTPADLTALGFAAGEEPVRADAEASAAGAAAQTDRMSLSTTVPPWSAAHPYTNLYDASDPVIATVTGNMRVTQVGREYDTHHIVLDLGKVPFPLLEGQSIGVIPPGTDESGRPHHARQYSVSSARHGERPGYNNLSLTVKRVLQDRQGNPVHGVASNYVCDLKVGDQVKVIGPFGTSFLMPNHPGSHIVMICTGTGAAPMRGMLRWRHYLRTTQNFASGKMMLFFGARSKEDLPFFGRLHKLPKDFMDVHLAFSRTPGQPKRYVQDLMRERAADLAALLADEDSYFYVCGLKAMEEGVVLALRDIAEEAGLNWSTLAAALKRNGRLHLETY